MSKKEIKIYYDTRTIRLTNYFPLDEPANTMVSYYDGSEKLVYRFIEFIENENFTTFYLWSGSGFREMKYHFFSFFKVIEAAGGLVRNERDEILVIFRGGKWDLPKGKIDKNETLKEAAVREVKEETGLKEISLAGKLMTTYHLYFRKERMILKPTVWFEMYAGSRETLVPAIKEDISEVVWKRMDEIPALLDNTYRSLEDLFNHSRLYQPGT